jgi:hypothetical protein
LSRLSSGSEAATDFSGAASAAPEIAKKSAVVAIYRLT